MGLLSDWSNATALILSCPGQVRHPQAAIMPISTLPLGQRLLGAEGQLSQFVAQQPGLSGRFWFAPMPEIFPGIDRLAVPQGRIIHLRFGPARQARLLKGAHNVAVLAEQPELASIAGSAHPFAAGHVLPAAIASCASFGQSGAWQRPDGTPLPVRPLPPGDPAADIIAAPKAGPEGLACLRLADFEATAWETGQFAHAPLPTGGICLPWNLAHAASIVPLLLDRLVRLLPATSLPPLILLPFHDLGRSDLIADEQKKLALAALNPGHAMGQIHLARVQHLGATQLLCAAAPKAWIDGNCPEHRWTMARLAAAGWQAKLIDPACSGAPGTVPADEALQIGTAPAPPQTAFIPSIRNLAALLAPSPKAKRRRR